MALLTFSVIRELQNVITVRGRDETDVRRFRDNAAALTASPSGRLLSFASPAVAICFVFQRYPVLPEDLRTCKDRQLWAGDRNVLRNQCTARGTIPTI